MSKEDEEKNAREEAHRLANEGNPMNRPQPKGASGNANDGNPMNDTGRFNYKHIADEKEKAEDISFEEYLRRQQLNQQETREQDEKSKTDFRDQQKAQNEQNNRDFERMHTYNRGR